MVIGGVAAVVDHTVTIQVPVLHIARSIGEGTALKQCLGGNPILQCSVAIEVILLKQAVCLVAPYLTQHAPLIVTIDIVVTLVETGDLLFHAGEGGSQIHRQSPGKLMPVGGTQLGTGGCQLTKVDPGSRSAKGGR